MHCDEEGKLLCQADCPLARSMREGIAQEGHVYLHHKSGHRVPVRVRAFPVRLCGGIIVGAAETFEERPTTFLSERRQAMLAAHGCLDGATGLPNRFIMESHLRESVSLFTEHHLPFGVLAIKVEQVKQFELAHSGEALSAVLHASARSIAHFLGPDSLLGHWTENQWLAVVSDCSLLDLERFRKRIRDLVRSSGIEWWGDHLTVSVEVRYAMVEAGEVSESIIERAEKSLQQHAAREESNQVPKPPGSGQPRGS
jgi:GGDEF domain-containing protein